MTVAMVLFQGIKEKNESLTINDNSTFWYKWRIYYLIPIPFMIIASLIFIVFANKETIEYYVKNNKKDQAILLMQ